MFYLTFQRPSLSFSVTLWFVDTALQTVQPPSHNDKKTSLMRFGVSQRVAAFTGGLVVHPAVISWVMWFPCGSVVCLF